jgi:cell wall-associated NlpC family hydrolase
MPTACRSLRLSLLAVFVCGLPGAAANLPSPVQITDPTTIQTALLQLGSKPHGPKLDCTHWVHDIYERAGLHYPYANSRTLYGGILEFRRVLFPQSGDLVVWRGHAGIIVDPSRGGFVSALGRGIRISSYLSYYWKRRGNPRFFRYGRSVEKSEESDQAANESVISGFPN